MISENWNEDFKNRLQVHFDELKWLYMELYNNAAALKDFLDMLYFYYDTRNTDLKEWDEARNTVKDWYKGNEMLGMMLYTQCFGKDLKGVK